MSPSEKPDRRTPAAFQLPTLRINRRRFLYGSAALSAAALFCGPALLRGRDLNGKLNIGMIPTLVCHEVWPHAHMETDIHKNAISARHHNEIAFDVPYDGDFDCSAFTGQMALHFCRRTTEISGEPEP